MKIYYVPILKEYELESTPANGTIKYEVICTNTTELAPQEIEIAMSSYLSVSNNLFEKLITEKQLDANSLKIQRIEIISNSNVLYYQKY